MVRQLKQREYHLEDGRVLSDLGYQKPSNRIHSWSKDNIVLHRADGPAVKYPSGYEAYWVHGIRHRIDGPAIVYSDERLAPQYFLFGKRMGEAAYLEAVKKLNINSLAIYLIDSSDIIRKVAQQTIKWLEAKADGSTIK